MGLCQQGRSRTWINDRLWWVIVVEFQPSSWSRGTYLNVGACWLWKVKNSLSFDAGSRVEDFAEFETTSDFEVLARTFAGRAAVEVESLRLRFASIAAVADHYVAECKQFDRLTFRWPWFHCGISCALSGRLQDAAKLWEVIVTSQASDFDWITEARRDARALASATESGQDAIRDEVVSRIVRTRALLKLEPVDPSVLSEALCRNRCDHH